MRGDHQTYPSRRRSFPVGPEMRGDTLKNRLLYAASCMVLLFCILPMPGLCADAVKEKGATVRKMTLADAVLVALTNNVTLRSAYLDRYLQRIDLQVAERQYYLPTDPKLTLGAARSSSYSAPPPDGRKT